VLGLGLALAPGKLWDPLSSTERGNLVRWLSQVNDYPLPETNWQFFLVLINLGLQSVGADYSQANVTQALTMLDTFYLSDGWYSDGSTEQRDYYISFGMHFYALIYSRLLGTEDPKRAHLYKDRAMQFAKEFLYWFSDDGSALPFGRSLTYRFAQCAFWGAMAFCEVEAFPWGVIKGIILRHLRWWFQQPIFSLEGLLTIGYRYPNLIMAEEYNGSGSPYWALKSFLPILLPADHPFWVAEEEPLPPRETQVVQPQPHMVILREKNHVIALTSGQYANWDVAHNAEKYSKFAYSTVFGFSVPKGRVGLSQGAFDSMLAFSQGDNLYNGRQQCEEYHFHDEVIRSKWKVYTDVEIETWLVPLPPWHVRVQRIVTPRDLDTAEGGFAIARLKNSQETTHYLEKRALVVLNREACTGIWNLYGERTVTLIDSQPNTNVIHARTRIPMVVGHLFAGEHWYVTAILGTVDTALGWSTFKRCPIMELAGDSAIEFVLDRVRKHVDLSAPLRL